MMIPLSVLDLAPIVEGGDAAQSFRNSLRSRPACGRLGLPPLLAGRASQHAGNRQCRNGRADRPYCRGDIDHPGRRRRNHAAEPRAAGDRRAIRHARFAVSRVGSISGSAGRRARTGTARALRRNLDSSVDQFPRDVVELMAYFRRAAARSTGPRRPGAGLDVPVWILGSSLFGAQLAAALGCPSPSPRISRRPS